MYILIHDYLQVCHLLVHFSMRYVLLLHNFSNVPVHLLYRTVLLQFFVKNSVEFLTFLVPPIFQQLGPERSNLFTV
jgi:hypothetical protein